jgi:hypothetical protein
MKSEHPLEWRAGQVDLGELSPSSQPISCMDRATLVSDPADDRRACEEDCRNVEAALAQAKEREAWTRFGRLSFEAYVSWITENPATFWQP